MSLPILYPSTETAFETNGLGILADALKCNVTEERNGMFELEMRYPITGVHYADIALRSMILAKPNPVDDPQPFRVYRITKPINGIVTVYAQHIIYDLNGIPAQPFTAPSAALAMQALKDNAVTPCPFEFWTDRDTVATMTNSVPQSIRSLLGGVRGSVLDVYGGEYAFDRYRVRLYTARGMDRGVSIRYGKNLTSLQQDENCAAVYTGVYPFWTGSDGELVQLPEKTVNAPGTYDFVRILTLDLSSEWQEKPTAEQIRARAERYIKENNIGVPKVSLSISFVHLEQYEEYKHLALQERVSLCDTVNVKFPRLGVSATAKVYKTVYDVLRDRWESVELGDARTTLADTIAAQGQEIKNLPQSSAMQAAVLSLTAAILGASGGATRLLDTNNDGMPDTLYIADDPDPKKAIKVWRFNYEGWGASKNGYNGPFVLGASLEDGFIADFITAGTLNANLIKVINLQAESIVAGILSSVDGKTKFDLNNGQISSEAKKQSGVTQKVIMNAGNIFLAIDGKMAFQVDANESINGGAVFVGNKGNVCASILGNDAGGVFALNNSNDPKGSLWSAFIDPLSGLPWQRFLDAEHKLRISIDTTRDGRPNIQTLRENGSTMFNVQETKNGEAIIYLGNKNGKVIWQAYEGTNGLNGMALYDHNGNIIWQVYENADGTASVYQKTQATISTVANTQSAQIKNAVKETAPKPIADNIPEVDRPWIS